MDGLSTREEQLQQTTAFPLSVDPGLAVSDWCKSGCTWLYHDRLSAQRRSSCGSL